MSVYVFRELVDFNFVFQVAFERVPLHLNLVLVFYGHFDEGAHRHGDHCVGLGRHESYTIHGGGRKEVAVGPPDDVRG